MTTIIVTKDRILSDGLVSVGNRVDTTNFKKIRKIGGYLVGGAGRLSSILTFFSWMEQVVRLEGIQEHVPELVIQSDPEKEDDEFMALVVHPDGEIYLHEGNDPTRAYPLHCEYYAIGSGSDYALAALDAGVSPEAAMEVAKYRDTHSGGETFVELLANPEDEEVLLELSEDMLKDLTKEELINLLTTGSITGEPEQGIEGSVDNREIVATS